MLLSRPSPTPDESRMRVLHVIGSLDPKSGGPSTALRGLVSAERKIGLQVSVLATFRASDDASHVHALQQEEISVRWIGPTRGKLGCHREIARAVDECVAAADIVH